jgi:hypothetical protein
MERREHQRDGVIRPRIAVNDQAMLVHVGSMGHSPPQWLRRRISCTMKRAVILLL